MIENLRDAFEHRPSQRLPRGEFWIGASVFEERKTEDNVEAHVAFCDEMGMDFVSIPVGQSGSYGFSYRAFDPSQVQEATGSGLFLVTAVSGPFQRVVDEKGLRLVLADVARDSAAMRGAIEREAVVVDSLLEACVNLGANAAMIAEDVAYGGGSFLSPGLFRDILLPLYIEFVDNIHRRGAFAVFHSCGDITRLMVDIVSSKFDGLSCQAECLDLPSLKQTFGDKIALFTGVSREFLDSGRLSFEQRRRFGRLVRDLGTDGGFVLSSSSGLESSDTAARLAKLYRLADGVWHRTEGRENP